MAKGLAEVVGCKYLILLTKKVEKFFSSKSGYQV